ncbi:hypothetical protein C5E26_21600 [Pectobacterium parmentieri]|nr:hypothetical protein C5E26_21600 [Pectobacterium parmentieri]
MIKMPVFISGYLFSGILLARITFWMKFPDTLDVFIVEIEVNIKSFVKNSLFVHQILLNNA